MFFFYFYSNVKFKVSKIFTIIYFHLTPGELIPLAVRTLGNGVAVTAYSLFAFIISLTFPSLLRHFSTYTAFWMYSAFSLLGVGIGYWLPETKGKTLEEIEAFFAPKENSEKPRKAERV